MGHDRVDDPFWMPLDGSGRSDADVGSKAASLDRLLAAGPRYGIEFVLPAEA